MVDFDWAGLELDWTGQDWAGWTGLDWIGLDSNESGLDQVRASSVPLLVGGVDRMRNGDGDGDGNWEPLDLPGSRGGRVDRRCRWILGGQRERGHWLVGRDDAAQNRGREGRQDTARQLRVGYVGRAGEVAQVRQCFCACVGTCVQQARPRRWRLELALQPIARWVVMGDAFAAGTGTGMRGRNGAVATPRYSVLEPCLGAVVAVSCSLLIPAPTPPKPPVLTATRWPAPATLAQKLARSISCWGASSSSICHPLLMAAAATYSSRGFLPACLPACPYSVCTSICTSRGRGLACGPGQLTVKPSQQSASRAEK